MDQPNLLLDTHSLTHPQGSRRRSRGDLMHRPFASLLFLHTDSLTANRIKDIGALGGEALEVVGNILC
jgi:hypothetical protein